MTSLPQYGIPLPIDSRGRQDALESLERLIKSSEAEREDDEHGVYSGEWRQATRVVERPGVSPALVVDSSVFLTLEDLGSVYLV
jgi:hypothetical protein